MLLRDKSGDTAVNFVGEKPFGPHRDEAEHAVECFFNGQIFGQGERFCADGKAVEFEGLLRHIAEDFFQIEVNGCGVVCAVEDDHSPIAGHFADKSVDDLFAFAEGVEEMGVFGTDEQGIVFLIFGAPDFEYGQGFIANGHRTNIDAGTRRLNDFFENIAVATRALIVDADNGVLIAEFDTGADHAIEFLFHFCIAALHGVEIEFGFVFALHHARSSTAAHANAIGWPTDFGDEHLGFWLFFICMTCIHLPRSRR